MMLRILVFVLVGACSTPAKPRPESPTPVEAKKRTDCSEVPEHPSFASDSLELRLHLREPRPGMIIPPFNFEVHTKEVLSSAARMTLTIHGPSGQQHVQEFSFENQQEQCDPHCLPSGPVNNCRPRRCWMQRYRPRAQSIPPEVYRGAPTGQWTFVLHRLDTDDRVSVTARLLGGSTGGKPAPAAKPPCPVQH